MSNRRAATAADMTLGALVFKGNGNTQYRVSWIGIDGRAGEYAVTKATTKRDATGNGTAPLSAFTISN